MKVQSAQRRSIDARAREIAVAELVKAERTRAGLAALKRGGGFRYCQAFSVVTALLCGILAAVFSTAVILCFIVFF